MVNKPIKFSRHALIYKQRRGFNEEEVIETIKTGSWEPAELGRLQCRKDFPYDKEWNGKFYHYKQVRPIFVDEEFGIVVITVYTYYYRERKIQ